MPNTFNLKLQFSEFEALFLWGRLHDKPPKSLNCWCDYLQHVFGVWPWDFLFTLQSLTHFHTSPFLFFLFRKYIEPNLGWSIWNCWKKDTSVISQFNLSSWKQRYRRIHSLFCSLLLSSGCTSFLSSSSWWCQELRTNQGEEPGAEQPTEVADEPNANNISFFCLFVFVKIYWTIILLDSL